MSARSGRLGRLGLLGLAAIALLGASPKPRIPWEDLTEVDWLYSLATRFSLLDSHRVHYKTPTAELATLLEARPESEALRHLAQAQMDLGQRDKASTTIEKWAATGGAEQGEAAARWDEAARWAWSYGAHGNAFRFAETAIQGLEPSARRALANLRIEWAEQQPGLQDRREMQRKALELDPSDWVSAYRFVDGDIVSGALVEAERGIANLPRNTPAEPGLVLLARVRVAQRRAAEVVPALETALDQNPRRGRAFATVFVSALDQGAKARPGEWRQLLDARFDGAALTRLFVYFKGQERGDACLALLQQMDRRHEKNLDRDGWALLSSLYSEIDAVPEAFRARLAAATFSEAKGADTDFAELIRLALRAGGRPLAWGNYSDADYRWVARMDPTPGFWTGGLSLLLTGEDWNEAHKRLEAESVPERTFGAARELLAELIARNPASLDIPSLKAEVMQRHVDRGEGAEALALLRDLETTAPAGVRQRARRIGLLALRQTKAPLADEMRLYQTQLRFLAADGASPGRADAGPEAPTGLQAVDFADLEAAAAETVDSRLRLYRPLLDEAIARLEERDKTHRSALRLILTELDRLPDAEALWLDLALRLDRWNLDDELGPRYEAALSRFEDASWWNRMARFLTRQKRQSEIRGLAERIAATFRGSALFERATTDIRIEIPEQPKVGTRARLVPWGDWVVLKALERFPHSPVVLRAAEGRLIRASAWSRTGARVTDPRQKVVVEDSLLNERRWAVFAADAEIREAYLAGLMRTDALPAKLIALDRAAERTPVDDLVLVEGYARLSLFEKAAEAASRLSVAYPGDESVARLAVQIHRSLAAIDLSHERSARVVVDRASRALIDPNPLITELGELYEETGRPEMALSAWKALLDRDPGQEERIKETASLLWDYGHMKEALDTIEQGRKRLSRPRMLAFEAGVLREEVRDIDGAVREYLEAVRPEAEGDSCYCSGFENDQRSLRRLAQLMGRPRVLARVLAMIESLKPGNEGDEKTLLAFWPLGGIETPTPGLDADVDDWIDAMDQPNDAVGREERETKRLLARGAEHRGITRVAQALVARATAMVPASANGRFLSALEASAGSFSAFAWAQAEARDRFFTSIVARRAEVAPTVEERVRLEIDLAERLATASRLPEAEALWKSLNNRIDALPESGSKIKSEVSGADFNERHRGFDRARAAWDGLIAKYPWSLGVIEDRASFLKRHGKAVEARQALEDATARAAQGHLGPLLTRLISESLEARDLPRASRALDRLLKASALTLIDEERLGAVSLQARLRIQQDPSFAAVAFASAEADRFKPELRAQVFAQVARAADVEKAPATAVSVWIEALNRSTERDWLKEASRSARRGGKPETLVSFFEQQQRRSPRDVRWAVAARELRVATDDLKGGIEMARLAASIRPDRQQLWDEAVELMERDQQFVEAADFLEGWNVARPADPSVAGRRSELYIRGGDLRKAVAVERSTLDAFGKSEPSDEDMTSRTADAARRLWNHGQPQLAWRFLAPEGRPDQIAASGLSVEEQFQLALLNQAFLPLLNATTDDPERRGSAALVLSEYGRIEQREQVLTWLMEKLFPAARTDQAFLNGWWSFIEGARLEPSLRFKVAQRFARQIAGPWATDTPVDLLNDASEVVVARVPRANGGETDLRIQPPDFDALWVAHLVRADESQALAAFLRPRFASLIETVRGRTAITADSARLPWTLWLDSAPALQALARGLQSEPDLVASLSSVFEERPLWDRFWAVAARGWETSALLAELRPASRVAWLSFWERPVAVTASSPTGLPAGVTDDPVLVTRRAAINETSLALARLLADPAQKTQETGRGIAPRLLGPVSVSEILGRDAKFTWTMFEPRTSAASDLLETGDDRIVGRGIESLRFPGALWGDRPGAAWYALQTYARYRAQDPSAIEVPGEWPESGGETERALLTARLALALQGPAAALAQVDRLALRVTDPDLLRFRLRLMVDAGRRVEAIAVLKLRLTSEQKTLNEDTLRTFAAMAEDLDLPSPISLLDPAVPVLPALLASIYDKEGAEAGRKFKTDDAVGFRAALAPRFAARASSLKAAELRVWLSELWATESAPLPVASLNRLGDFWPFAAGWAETVPAHERVRAIAAIEALPNTALLEALPATLGDAEARRVLMIRVHLARGDDSLALSLFRAAVDALSAGEALGLTAVPLLVANADSNELAADVPRPAQYGEDAEATPHPKITQLRALRAPFVAARKEGLVESEIVAWLDERIDNEPDALHFWSMRFEVSPASERAEIVRRLDRAWRRGDIAAYRQSEVAAMLARDARELAGPWVQAHPPGWSSFPEIERHAESLNRAGLPREAAGFVAEARGKLLFRRFEEIRAFDLWRRSADAAGNAPEAWKQALRFWRDDPEGIFDLLQARLKDHPFDVLSARAAQRRPTAMPPPLALLAARALRDVDDLGLIDVAEDEALLRLRAVRSLLARPRAAAATFGLLSPESVATDLTRRRFRAADVDGALSDLARLASQSLERSTLQSALDLLADRKWTEAQALRAEIAAAPVDPPMVSHRVIEGRSYLFRPRDLTFGLVSRIVQADLSRRPPRVPTKLPEAQP